jgi:hypothetical protein
MDLVVYIKKNHFIYLVVKEKKIAFYSLVNTR